MKKILLICLGTLLMLFSINSGTSGQDHKFTVKVNPLSAAGGPFWVAIIPVTGEYKVQFETAVAAKQSFQVGASYIGPSLILNLDELSSDSAEISGIKTSGFRVTGTYKFFLTSDASAPEGLYVGPYVSYASAKIASKENSDDKISAVKLNVNGIIGYQMISDGGFALDIFTGIGYRKVDWEFDNESNSSFDLGTFDGKGGLGVALGISFGLAF